MTVVTYLDQLDERASELGVDLKRVCELEGVAATTLARWRKGEATCREETAHRLFARMDAMAPVAVGAVA